MNDLVVIIPCYEPSEQKFLPYIESLVKTEVRGVVIVNDGSGERFNGVFEKVCALDRDRIQYLTYSGNRGKGYALKTAYKFCKENYRDCVFVTADCDGQHKIEDVFKVGKAVRCNPHALVLGVRDFSLPHVPKRSRSGNTKTRALLKFFYGIDLKDTQTGLRGCSYSILDELLSISGNRFEYETNQLIRLNKKQIQLRQVEIETVYEQKADDVDKISHFKTFSDSMKVIGVLLKNLGWYFLSSVLAGAVDVAVFGLLFGVILKTPNPTTKTLVATVAARVISSVVNFIFNYKLVFHGNSRKSIFRYYILWLFQLAVSFGLARLWAELFSSELLVTAIKAVTDILLAVLSYQIQRVWVFADGKDKNKFFGGFARFARGLLRVFRRKYKVNGVDKDDCQVFVCRHLNMHGCYTAVRSLQIDVHIMAFSPFFSFKTAFKHYSRITFVKDGKAKFGSRFKAFFPAIFVPAMLKSAKAVPVYRKDAGAFKTIKQTNEYLLKGQSVIVFPDIDYQASQQNQSEIYKGFLLLEKLYFKRTGKHLKFTPLFIDDKNKTLNAKESVAFSDGNFEGQFDNIADRIRIGIQNLSFNS